VPQLRRQAAGDPKELPTGSAVHCGAESGAATCELLDDLQALEGPAPVCGPAGPTPLEVCPPLKKRRIVRETTPLVAKPPCGEGAAANVQVRLEDSNGRVLSRVLFYDDPSCHKPMLTPPTCKERQPRPAYYRVLSVTSYFRDEGV
jgi:hypothetical protein